MQEGQTQSTHRSTRGPSLLSMRMWISPRSRRCFPDVLFWPSHAVKRGKLGSMGLKISRLPLPCTVMKHTQFVKSYIPQHTWFLPKYPKQSL